MKVYTILVLVGLCLNIHSSFGMPEVKIGYETNLPPYMDKSLDGGGRTPSLIRDTLAMEGIKVNEVWAPWSRTLDSAKKGLIDCAGSAYYTEDRAEIFNYSLPHLFLKTVVFTKKARKLNAPLLKSLAGIRTGLMRSYAYSKDILDAKGVFYIRSTTLHEMITKFVSGKLDAFIAEKSAALHIIETKFPKLLPKIRVNTPFLAEHSIHMMCLKRLKNSKEIIERFNRSLKKIKKTEKYR